MLTLQALACQIRPAATAGNHATGYLARILHPDLPAFPLGNPKFSKHKTKLFYEGLHSHDK